MECVTHSLGRGILVNEGALGMVVTLLFLSGVRNVKSGVHVGSVRNGVCDVCLLEYSPRSFFSFFFYNDRNQKVLKITTHTSPHPHTFGFSSSACPSFSSSSS